MQKIKKLIQKYLKKKLKNKCTNNKLSLDWIYIDSPSVMSGLYNFLTPDGKNKIFNMQA